MSAGAGPPVALAIAGVDSSGGAGLHADLRTFAAHEVHGASVVAALTAQSTLGIESVHLVPSEFVRAQLDAVLGDLTVRATKTGFLASAANVDVVAVAAREGALANLVVDPVLVSADGRRLFAEDVERAYRERLLPLAAIATPNRAEAGVLTGMPVETTDDMARAAVAIRDLGPRVVVVKGGAADEGADAVDVVATESGVSRLVLPRIVTANDHGSGCSFAAALTALLARGSDITSALGRAKQFVHHGLNGAKGWQLGAGHGPIDTFGWTRPD